MLWSYGLFNKTVGGVVEMYYQFDHDYNFNSDKFEKAFNFKPTAYKEGIKLMSETLYKKSYWKYWIARWDGIANPGYSLV